MSARKGTSRTSIKTTASMPGTAGVETAVPPTLLTDLRALISTTRQRVAQGINSALVLLYWQIGQRIRTDILEEKRAGYGEQIFYALSRKLTLEFGRGFSQANLFHMVRFAEVFPCAEQKWETVRPARQRRQASDSQEEPQP